MRIARRLARALVIALVLIALICWYLVWTRSHPADSPFTELDLTQKVGMFTGRKIAALKDDANRCEALLFRAGIRYRALPPAGAGQCAYDDVVRLTKGGTLATGFRRNGSTSLAVSLPALRSGSGRSSSPPPNASSARA